MGDPGDLADEFSLRRLLDRIDDAVFVLDAQWRFAYANETAAQLLGTDLETLVGSPAEEGMGAERWAQFLPQLEEAMRSSASTSFVALTSRTRRWFDCHVHPHDGRLIVVARDVTPVRESVKVQENLLRRSQREMHFSEALNRLNRIIVSEPDIDSVLDRVLREGMDALEVESAYIDVLDDGELILRHASGMACGAQGRKLEPERMPHVIEAADKREPVAINDVCECGAIEQASLEDAGIRSVLSAPLIVQSHILGFLSFANHSTVHIWTAEEVRFVRRIAVRVSLALQTLRSHEELRASEKRFRSTFDLAPVGIANHDLDGRWLRLNARMCEILGRSRQELLAMPFSAVTHPEDLGEDERLFRLLVAGEIPSYSMEKRYTMPDGTVKWGQISRSLVRTLDGEPDYVVTIVEDIDARRRAEDQLAKSREHERLLTDMLESASQPFAVGELGGDIIMCNDAFVDLTGYTMNELAEDGPAWLPRFTPPEWQQIADGGVHFALAEGRPARFGRRYVRRDGSVVPVEVLAHLFVPESGKPLVYAFITDVTERVVAEERSQLAHALNVIDEELGKQLSADTSLPVVLQTAVETLGLKCATVLSAELEGYRVVYGVGLPDEVAGELFCTDDVLYGARAIRENRTVVVDQIDSDLPESCLANRLSASSLVAVPLRRGNERHGAIVFCRGSESPTFNENEVAFITTLASHASLAVENAQLYENEHRVARTLQDALLKLPDHIAGVEFARSYQSASAIAKVGGDFYDIFELEDGRIGIVVGDVAGKGLEAAALNARARATIRAELGVTGRSPADVLARVNDVFARESENHDFITVFLGVLHRSDGRFVYASGGHTTSALISHTGRIEQLPSTGPIVGAFPKMEFTARALQMEPGDEVFAYTDGLVEARGSDGLYGEERLFGSLAEHAEDGPQQLVDHVIADALAYATRLTDDVAMLAVKWLG